MAKVLLTLKLDPSKVSLGEVSRRLNIEEGDLDADFGVVPIDPRNNLYSVMVDEKVAEGAASGDDVGGPYSDPEIEPMGPGS